MLRVSAAPDGNTLLVWAATGEIEGGATLLGAVEACERTGGVSAALPTSAGGSSLASLGDTGDL